MAISTEALLFPFDLSENAILYRTYHVLLKRIRRAHPHYHNSQKAVIKAWIITRALKQDEAASTTLHIIPFFLILQVVKPFVMLQCTDGVHKRGRRVVHYKCSPIDAVKLYGPSLKAKPHADPKIPFNGRANTSANPIHFRFSFLYSTSHVPTYQTPLSSNSFHTLMESIHLIETLLN
ncbi:hypothetical protein L2E82_31193 [Cichorium intybus]|uniref:Uncharacterized protein n=1 Tax=Cichorium intybus TaxID=13427 RepID=A0ACB9D289_CICIN|nr:hypothetical protein L2E82_31193 [Cichorium intybus]